MLPADFEGDIYDKRYSKCSALIYIMSRHRLNH